MSANLIDSYLQLDEDPDELRTPDEDMLDLELHLSSHRQMLIHTQPIYLINTSKLQTPQQQVIRADLSKNSPWMTESSVFSCDSSLRGLLHEQDEFHEGALHFNAASAFTPDSDQCAGHYEKTALLPMPSLFARDDLDFACAPDTMADDELFFQLAAAPAGPLPNHVATTTTTAPPLPAIAPAMVPPFAPNLGVNNFADAVNPYHDSVTWNSPEQCEFVHALTSKLSRYCGYFVADSKEMEYFDKIRLQEIEYRLCKTYFH
ncbi:HDL301Wp [Eremothecium sinecaudum]|uniref:HDL301Wp n=1 Tax=Eremothecium sinecaudum TaxID=45286 RepID=A0A109UZ23_9SACH|nr:HDL301Wp [Eremothecium sinecaudum]AMD20443.1 HDL301Wp [Eremothecium sinecaudum]